MKHSEYEEAEIVHDAAPTHGNRHTQDFTKASEEMRRALLWRLALGLLVGLVAILILISLVVGLIVYLVPLILFVLLGTAIVMGIRALWRFVRSK